MNNIDPNGQSTQVKQTGANTPIQVISIFFNMGKIMSIVRSINKSIGLFDIILLSCIAIYIGRMNYLFIIPTIIATYNQEWMHTPHTYQVSSESPEYITFERVGNKSYKISFHKTPKDPGTDYFIITTPNNTGYPVIYCTFLNNDSNEVVVTPYDNFGYYIDTVVTQQYRLISTPDLLKEDTLELPNPMTAKARDLLSQRNAWIDSIRSLPFREEVTVFQKIVMVRDSLNNTRPAKVLIRRVNS